jgi:hypothetical protein
MRSRHAQRTAACLGFVVAFFALAIVTDHERVTVSLLNLIALIVWAVFMTVAAVRNNTKEAGR